MTKRKKLDKKDEDFFRAIFKFFMFIVKIPYYIFKLIATLLKKSKEIVDKEKVDIKRKKMSSVYSKFKDIKIEKGNYRNFEKNIFNSDSKIGVILGSRGSGKTAFALRFLENFHSLKKRGIFALGFNEKEMPDWINVVSDISKIKNNSFVLIDEGGILFSSRNAMSSANKLLSELILIARHKNLNILFISQNSSNLDVNILRQADFLVLKPSSFLQKDFERKIIQKIYDKISDYFEKIDDKGKTYIYSDIFKGFVSSPLPSFWKTEISKSFK